MFDKALEKLWLHGGAEIAPDETVRRGAPNFVTLYEKQSAYRLDPDRAHASICGQERLSGRLQLVAHFGDARDAGTPCGQCDVCAPDSCIAQAHREPSAAEKLVASRSSTLSHRATE